MESLSKYNRRPNEQEEEQRCRRATRYIRMSWAVQLPSETRLNWIVQKEKSDEGTAAFNRSNLPECCPVIIQVKDIDIIKK